MGYHIRTGLVEENASTLDMILSRLDKGDSLRYDCINPEAMNTLKYQFNRILNATGILTQECNGRFVGLRGRVKVRQDWKRMWLIIEPNIQASSIASLVPVQPNEFDAISKLKSFEGQMDLVRFRPTNDWDIASFRLALQEIGFDLMPNPDEPGWIGGEMDNGDMEYAVARKEVKKPSGFDMLSAFSPEESSNG